MVNNKDKENISKNNPNNVFIHKVNNKDREIENLDWLYEPRRK